MAAVSIQAGNCQGGVSMVYCWYGEVFTSGDMAELVDAPDLKSGDFIIIWVQVPLSPNTVCNCRIKL